MAKVGKRPDGEAPKCECGCGGEVRWLRGRGWSKFVQGHHIRIKNPNTGDHVRGDRNPMRQPEVLAQMSGENHWRHRPENKKRSKEYLEEQRNRKGPDNSGWKGGVTTHTDGRLLTRVGDHYEFRSRVVVEKSIGRKLLKSEIVHHRNGNVRDDRIENLELMESQAKHVSIHNSVRSRKKKMVLDSSLAPMCACGCGERVTVDTHRNKYNKFRLGHWIKSMIRSRGN